MSDVPALKQAMKELGKTSEEVIAIWDNVNPHFDGAGAHRYENGECVYCLRPQDREFPTFNEDDEKAAMKDLLEAHPNWGKKRVSINQALKCRTVPDEVKVRYRRVVTSRHVGQPWVAKLP